MEAAEARNLNFLEEIIESDLASGKCRSVMTRFPPEPNGYLHIGHAKSICLNFGLAKKYGGKTNLRFDDTNPVKEDTEYVDSIKEDIKWLGFQWENERYASDYFDQLYEWAEELIRKGLAYVDDQTQEEIRATRGTVQTPGTESPWRNRSVEENLKLFRAASEHYLRSLSSVNTDLRIMVRQLEPTSEGLPLQFYFFTREKEWGLHEQIASDVIEYLIASMPEFGLRVYQKPSGLDIHDLTGHSTLYSMQ